MAVPNSEYAAFGKRFNEAMREVRGVTVGSPEKNEAHDKMNAWIRDERERGQRREEQIPGKEDR